MTTIISLLNQKGGVGKTTLTANLGGVWAKRGLRVLLVDNDPQASLTQGFFGPDTTAGFQPVETIACLYDGTAISADQAIRETRFPGLSIMLGSMHAARWNNGAPNEMGWHYQDCLREALDEMREVYDVILVDCPPNLNLCSWAALVASDRVLVPVQPEDYGAQGLSSVAQSIEAVRTTANPSLGLLGFVISMLQPRRAIHQFYVETLRATHGDLLFSTMVNESTDFAEATMQRQPVVFYKPKGATAKLLGVLAQEVDARLSHPVTAGEAA